MANQLEMAIVQSILHLYSLRWSQRRIARELEIDREKTLRVLCELPAADKSERPSRLAAGKSQRTWLK